MHTYRCAVALQRWGDEIDFRFELERAYCEQNDGVPRVLLGPPQPRHRTRPQPL